MELLEGVGESSSPTRSYGGVGAVLFDIRNDVYNRLIEIGNEEALSNPDFREILDSHFNRLPPSYGLDVNIDRVEDVLLHRKFLALAKDPEKQPVFHVRFLENFWNKIDSDEEHACESVSSVLRPLSDVDLDTCVHNRVEGREFEPCFKLEDLNLEVGQTSDKRHGHVPIHEVIFSTPDKPKLLSQLSALLSDLGLNIREAHVFSTTDGYSLDVFVVDGWSVEDADSLHKAMEEAIIKSEDSWSGSTHSQFPVEIALANQAEPGNWEIDRRLLKIGEKIASGSCGDLYRGLYLGQDVAIKVLKSEHFSEASEDEFAQEVAILRQVDHENVVRFIGACTKSPNLCIVTEYMPGGSLYNYLHRNSENLKFFELLKFAIDVSKGMEYLHHSNIGISKQQTYSWTLFKGHDVIIHIQGGYANLTRNKEKQIGRVLYECVWMSSVVKVADFGVARFLHQEGVMTAETGTYRWMAPEVINHQPYDQKADVFSFAIVLWELVTAKVPYDNMTPLQAALGVRQGLRPELPENTHPKLLDLMQRCWDTVPLNRPPFSVIRVELEELQQSVQETSPSTNSS